MKYLKNNSVKTVSILLIAIILSSCSDFLKEYSQDLVIPKTPTDLDELLVGGVDGYLPSTQVESNNVNLIGSWFNILDDDLNGVIAPNAPMNWLVMSNFYFGYTTWQLEVGRNLKGTGLANDDQVWNDLYHRINAMNMILEQLTKINATTDQDKTIAKRIEGECHFLRAQFYFTLANLYGKAYAPQTAATEPAVPLKLTHYVEHDKNKKVQFERATVAEVYAQVVKDLQQAITALTESPQLRPQYRASKEAAMLLLSRVQLYMQDWDNAYKTATKLLALKNELQNMQLLENGGEFMHESNPEILFSQGSLCIQNSFLGNGGDLCVSNDLYNSFAANDMRKTIFFSKNTITDSIRLNRKYRMNIHRSKVSDAFTLRIGEAYLNAAEAAAMSNKEAEAGKWLAKLHTKRYYLLPTIETGDALITQIREERRRELCFEGHRWFDLRRYAACEKLPFKKEIIRYFSIYDNENRSLYMNTRVYKLLEDDPAYTFQIPKTLMDMEPDQIVNKREKRDFHVLDEKSND